MLHIKSGHVKAKLQRSDADCEVLKSHGKTLGCEFTFKPTHEPRNFQSDWIDRNSLQIRSMNANRRCFRTSLSAR
jgi:hypothetical protein